MLNESVEDNKHSIDQRRYRCSNSDVWRLLRTSESSLSSSKARCTMGPRTAYSTFFTVGFMVSMVNTLVRGGALFSDIFSLGSPRRVALRLDSALPGEEDDRGGEVSARTPEPPGSDSFRTGFKSRRFLGDSHCIRVADMLRRLSLGKLTRAASASAASLASEISSTKVPPSKNMTKRSDLWTFHRLKYFKERKTQR